MNDRIDDFPIEDELPEAFDAAPAEPTAEHIEQLRRQILSRTKPSMTRVNVAPPANERARTSLSRFRLPASLAVIATVVLFALLAIRPFANDAAAGLQDTLKATREALWIHGSTTITHGDKTIVAESWCSPAERIVAFRSPEMLHFVDYAQGLQSSYTDKHAKIFQWNADASTEGFGRDFVHALLNDQDLKSSFPLHDVSEVQKAVVNVDDMSGTQYSFHVRLKSNPDVGWETTVRTDPTTGRIRLWQDHHSSGMLVNAKFDYPDNGPRDIYELGAPLDTEVIELATPDGAVFGK
jgi:hypothetical protein